jgi:hypothetical protein
VIRLVLVTVAEVATFASALIYFLFKIVTALENIGGSSNSYLAKIRFGVRAIEKQSSALGPEVKALNERLASLTDRLALIDANLGATAKALGERKGGPL